MGSTGSIGNEMRFATERIIIDESAKKALRRCKEEERKAIAKGYRNIKVGKRTEILVPCDKDGNPTAIGRRKIEMMREHLNL